MNRRDFLTVAVGASALSIIPARSAYSVDVATSLYVKGLVIVDFDDPKFLRLGFPKAPGHKATLAVVNHSGARQELTIRGNGSVMTAAAPSLSLPKIVVPEIVRMKEFYGEGIKSKVNECPSVISIPYSAIRSVAADEVSSSRYTFVRADNGQEVSSFRPRQVAETIRIDLSSSGTMNLNNGKTSIPLENTRELRVEYAPTGQVAASGDAYADHFHHYFAYVERPAAMDFDVVPHKLSRNSAPAPRIGNNFMTWGDWPYCYVISIH